MSVNLLMALAAIGASAIGTSEAEAIAQRRKARILAFAHSWRGTPYKFGGSKRSGIDCSAYVRRLYRELFKVYLPRSTRGQVRIGKVIALDPNDLTNGLIPGDLLFYVSGGGKPRHVVLYLGEGQITHSKGGEGVIIEPINVIRGRHIAPRRIIKPPPGALLLQKTQRPRITEVPCTPASKNLSELGRRLSGNSLPSARILVSLSKCDLEHLKKGLAHRAPAAAILVDSLALRLQRQEERSGE